MLVLGGDWEDVDLCAGLVGNEEVLAEGRIAGFEERIGGGAEKFIAPNFEFGNGSARKRCRSASCFVLNKGLEGKVVDGHDPGAHGGGGLANK